MTELKTLQKIFVVHRISMYYPYEVMPAYVEKISISGSWVWYKVKVFIHGTEVLFEYTENDVDYSLFTDRASAQKQADYLNKNETW